MNNNEFIEMFERELSYYTEAPYVILTDSCTNAIFLTLMYLKNNNYIPSNMQTIDIPKNTYVGVPHSIINSGFHLSFNDKLWKGDYQLGNLPVWDSAVDFHKGMYRKGTFQCLSFQQKKRLNIGKGGAILTDDPKAYDLLKRMAFDGRELNGEIGQTLIQGWHMNMTPDDAAKGLLILNQITLRPDQQGMYKDYPDLSEIKYFKDLI